MLEIDQQVARMLGLVIERKLKLNRLKQERCLDNEEDQDDRNYDKNIVYQIHNVKIEEECDCMK